MTVTNDVVHLTNGLAVRVQLVRRMREPELLVQDFGQEEYYCTHHLFLTERALFLLCFDLSSIDERTFERQFCTSFVMFEPAFLWGCCAGGHKRSFGK